MHTIPYVYVQPPPRNRMHSTDPLTATANNVTNTSEPTVREDAWFALRAAVPLILAWLVAEFFYASPRFSTSLLGFVFTWLGLEFLWRGALRWCGGLR